MAGATKEMMKEKLEAWLDPGARGRRGFLRLGIAALALPLAAKLHASTPPGADPALPADRVLSFYNIHSGESAAAEYCRCGELQSDGLATIDRVLRDTRTNETKAIDVGLLDLLVLLALSVSTDEPFHVISGYRSPSTNEYLRKHGGGGVAAHSLHLVGKAVDIRVPGTKLRDLYRAAVALRRGGVGYYPAEDFIHVDTGRVRTW
jgi:uncharacterized protein YcbK (DUF882 family)